MKGCRKPATLSARLVEAEATSSVYTCVNLDECDMLTNSKEPTGTPDRKLNTVDGPEKTGIGVPAKSKCEG